VIGTLEKLSSSTKAAEGYIFKEKKEAPVVKLVTKESQPSNIATGVLRGAGALLKSLFDAILGIFVEPVVGGKKGGFKGAMKGVGKGVIGLVLKPVHGTLDLVALTARGITNTPKTIYLKVSSIFKKKERKPKSTTPVTPYFEGVGDSKECVVMIGESEDEYELSLDVDELRKQLLTGLLDVNSDSSVLTNKSIVAENANQLVLKEIKMRQKKQKRLKKYCLLKIKHEQKHFRKNLEKALSTLNEEVDIEELMKKKEKYSVKVLSGMAEIEVEGFPSPEIVTLELGDESECVSEFNEEENKNFNDVCNEFAVKCDIVTLGVENEEEHREIMDTNSNFLANSTIIGRGSTVYGRSFMQPDGFMSYMEGKFRKNPKHRTPPSIVCW
jgi:hypothetical protein